MNLHDQGKKGYHPGPESTDGESLRCPKCGGTNWKILRHPKRDILWRCECGYVYPPRPKLKSIEEIRQDLEDEHFRY